MRDIILLECKVKKTGNSSDEEEALKKFAEKSENVEAGSRKTEPEKIDTAQAESNLAASLSESDENESKTDKKKERSGRRLQQTLLPHKTLSRPMLYLK